MKKHDLKNWIDEKKKKKEKYFFPLPGFCTFSSWQIY